MTHIEELDIISIESLVSAPNALQLVRSMPAQDLLIAIKEAGLSESLELLELLSPEQVREIVDLEGWTGVHVSPQALGPWLEALFLANPRRAVQQIAALDIELLSFLLKNYAHIYSTAEGEEPAEIIGEYTRTLDHNYLIVFDPTEEHKSLTGALKATIEQLGARDMRFVLRLVEAVRWETPSMLEEEALRWREGRLQDMGFATTADAQSILAYLDPDSLTTPGVVIADSFHNPDHQPRFLSPQNLPSTSLFKQALDALPNDKKSRTLADLISTTNRLLMARNESAGDSKAIRATSTHVLNVVEMALVYLSKGNTSQIADWLGGVPVPRLFQIGHSLALRLARQWRILLQDPTNGLIGKNSLKIDSPLREVVAGLLLKEPVFYAGLTDPKRLDYVAFENFEQIGQTAKAISEAAFRAAFVGPKGLAIVDDSDACHAVLLATWLCQYTLTGEGKFKPLTKTDLLALQKTRLSWPTSWGERAQSYARIALGAVEAELANIKAGELELRFITSIITSD